MTFAVVNNNSNCKEINGGDLLNTSYYKGDEVINLKEPKNIYINRYVDTSTRFQGCVYLFKQWSGSVFRLIWHNLLFFMAAYTFLAIIYRYVLVSNEVAKEYFEILAIYCNRLGRKMQFWREN